MAGGIFMMVKHSTTYLDIKGSNLAGTSNAGGYREEKRFYSTPHSGRALEYLS